MVPQATHFVLQAVRDLSGDPDLGLCLVATNGAEFRCFDTGGDELGPLPSGTAKLRVYVRFGADVEYALKMYRVA